MPASAAAASVHPLAVEAVGEVGGALLEAGLVDADLLWVAVSPAFAGAAEDIVGALGRLCGASVTVGVVAEGVLVGDTMVPAGPAIAAVARSGVACRPLRLPSWPTLREPPPPEPDGAEGLAVVCFDPFSLTGAEVLSSVPGPCVGGSLSVGRAPGGNLMLLDGVVHHDGAVGVVVESPDSSLVLSPAWHPVGTAMTVWEVRPSDGAVLQTSEGPAVELYAGVREAAGEAGESGAVGALILDSGEVVALRVAPDGSPVPERTVAPRTTVRFALDTPEFSGRDLGRRLRTACDGRGAGRSAIALLDRRRPGAVHPGILGDGAVLGDTGLRSVCGALCGSQVVRTATGASATQGATAVAVF